MSARTPPTRWPRDAVTSRGRDRWLSPFNRFWAARVLSVAGDWITRSALPLHLLDLRGPSAAGAVFVALTAPRLLSPVAGIVADRVDTRRLLVGTEAIALVAAAGMLAAVESSTALLALTVASATASAVFAPAGRGAVPRLLPNGGIERGNAVLATGVTAASVIGPLLGAALLAACGMRVVLAVDVATFAASVTLLAGLTPLSGRSRNRTSVQADARAALSSFRSDSTFRRLAAWALLTSAATGAARPALVAITATVAVDRAEHVYGIALAVASGGTVLGAAASMRRRSSLRALRAATALYAIGHGGLAVAPHVTAVGLAAAAAGIGQGIQIPAMDSHIHRNVESAMLGRAFGALFGALYLGEAIGAALGAAAVSAEPRAAAALGAVAACAAFVPLREPRRHAAAGVA